MPEEAATTAAAEAEELQQAIQAAILTTLEEQERRAGRKSFWVGAVHWLTPAHAAHIQIKGEVTLQRREEAERSNRWL